MRRWIMYFAGGIACLGVGAAFYIVAGNVSATSDALRGVPTAPITVAILRPRRTSLGLGLLAQDDTVPRDDVRSATILFAGDIMLGRSVAEQIVKNGKEYPFANIKDTVSSADYAIANLEGPLTKLNGSPVNDMVFHFEPALASVLETTGFDAFSLANNHASNQGSRGVADTKINLAAVNIGYFGDQSSDAGTINNFEIRGQKFAMIGIDAVFRQVDITIVAKEIQDAKKDGAYVIIYSHWGDEYEHEQNARQTELAHAFIDAGADLVVGSHPHVVQGIETYREKMIFYSLGNLVFDQYFSVDTQQGLALRLNIGADGKQSIDLLPYEIPRSQPVFVSGDKKTKMLQDLAFWSDTALKDQIESGVLEINK